MVMTRGWFMTSSYPHLGVIVVGVVNDISRSGLFLELLPYGDGWIPIENGINTQEGRTLGHFGTFKFEVFGPGMGQF